MASAMMIGTNMVDIHFLILINRFKTSALDEDLNFIELRLNRYIKRKSDSDAPKSRNIWVFA